MTAAAVAGEPGECLSFFLSPSSFLPFNTPYLPFRQLEIVITYLLLEKLRWDEYLPSLFVMRLLIITIL